MTTQDSSIPPTTLLVADDEIEIGEIIQAVAEDLGFTVTCVHEGLKVVDLVERLKPDVIALDLRMPGADGVEIIRELGNRKCTANIILMSGMDQRTLSSVQALGRELDLEIGTTLTKPMSADAIEDALRPFLAPQKKASRHTPKPMTSRFDYGFSVLYEPELALNPLHGGGNNVVNVVPRWLKDTGEVLENHHLAQWLAQSEIGKGLSKMMLGSAFESLRVWGNQGFTPLLSLKLAPAMFLELGIPDILAEIADRNCVPRELIRLEIDETAVTHRKNSVVDVLSRLRIKGFRLSICIESEGESILPIIDTLPVDSVVLDMEYVSRNPDFLHNMETEFLYSSLVSVTNHKGIATCATNVNTPDIVTFVQRCKFNNARGSQLFTPVTADQIVPLYMEGDFADKSHGIS